MHTRAIAADISLNSHDRAALYAAAVRASFKGLGFGRTFIHVDIGVRRRWTYPGALPAWIKALGFDPTRR
jgi:zinc D-Ala-D-Ala carboxypeptidase